MIPFTVTARDRTGHKIAGLTPALELLAGAGRHRSGWPFRGIRGREIRRHRDHREPRGAGSGFARVAGRPAAATIVGRLPRSQFTTEEVWLHPNGKIAYLGTGGGGDRMYAIDISDPANPVVTDSLMANTRRINDIMTTPDGKYLVAHPRRRLRPQERDRHRLAGGPGPPEEDRGVSPKGSPAECTPPSSISRRSTGPTST